MPYPKEIKCIDCGQPTMLYSYRQQSRLCDDCKKKRIRESQYRSMKKRQKVYAQAIRFILKKGLTEEFTEWLKIRNIDAGRMLKSDWRRGH